MLHSLLKSCCIDTVWCIILSTPIIITVLDSGPGFDYEGWTPSDELMRPRGRGILIMREFTDDLEFARNEDGRFRVTLTKKLVPADADEES